MFLPLSDAPVTNSFIFPSNRNVFINQCCILASKSGFSGYCKPLFYLFSRHWKCVFETNAYFWLVDTGCLASENHFFSIFHILLTFKAYRKFIFTTNPLFWLLETDLLASGKHFVPIPQISILLQAVFPSCGKILNP